MTRPDYDVVIAGARIAGASLAIHLARAGARVLLLDKDRQPTDHVLSTHVISPPGMDELDALGVGRAVRDVTPAARVIRLDAEGALLELTFPAGRAGYCPRRERLDGLLQRSAALAGAELLDRTRVTSLIRTRQRVTGVRAAGPVSERTITASLVVGADGRDSAVARLAGAEEYLGYDAGRAAFWAYWDAPSTWTTDPAYRFDLYFSHFGGRTGVIFPTDHDQLLIGSWPPARLGPTWRQDPESMLRAALGAEPLIGPLIRDRRPAGRVRGTVKERFFFRRGAGEGWALAGDAGHHKDFVIGDGITEALLQSRGLASAIASGGDAALALWWRARDVAAYPWFILGREAGRPEPVSELLRSFLTRVNRHPMMKSRLIESVDRRLSPLEALPLSRIIAWALAAAAGRPRVIGDLVSAARGMVPIRRELRAMRRRLAEAELAAGRPAAAGD